MARRFRKKAGLGIVALPGVGGLGNDTVVEGDEYARFCPAILEEIFEAPSVSKPVFPEPVQEQAPSSSSEGSWTEEDPEPPNMSWRKSELVEYAEALGVDVEGMTKAQILSAIEEAEKEE